MLTSRCTGLLALAVVLTVSTSVAAQDRSATTTVKDAWITTQVQAKYFVDDVVKGRNIDVDTRNAIVTLTGDVSSAAERQRAVAKAKEVEGVLRVEDRLTIGRGARDKDKTDSKAEKAKEKADAKGSKVGHQLDLEKEISDAWITTKVQSKFYLDPDVKGLQIDVTTNGGVVTLTGKVASAAERQKALSLAKSTDGVKQVIDKLTAG